MPEFLFSKRDPRNARITDADTGELVYEVETPFGLVHRTSTLYDAQGQVVGEYDHVPVGSTITFQDRKIDLEVFCPRKRIIGLYVVFAFITEWSMLISSAWTDRASCMLRMEKNTSGITDSIRSR